MSFLQDFTKFMDEVRAVGSELDSSRKEISSTLHSSATDIKNTLTDTSVSISSTTQQVLGEVRQATTLTPNVPQNNHEEISSSEPEQTGTGANVE